MSFDLTEFLSHDAGKIAQFIKYAIVGGLSTGVHILVFFLCSWLIFPCLRDDDIVARLVRKFSGVTITDRRNAGSEHERARNAVFCNLLAFIVANIICYALNRLFVFKPDRYGILLEFTLFVGVSAISMVIGTYFQTVLISRRNTQTSIAFAANIISALLLNYAARRFFIFEG